MTYTLNRDTVIAVIGAGSMGGGIAQLAAQAGHAVRLFDTQPGAADRALRRIDDDLAGAVKRGRLDEVERGAVRARLAAVDTIEALAGCGLAVEAIVEKLEPKQSLFRQLEAVLGERAVLATNTSSISISAVAQGLTQPQRLIGWHFFNPATRMKLVEVIPGVETDPALVAALHTLGKAWGKSSVDAPNAPGFIVNRVARPYYAEGLRLLAERIASAQAIDRLLREAGGFALGPFELIDLIGIDVNLSVTESVFAATGWDTRYAPNLIQQELVRAGRFGRKSGRGFHDYRDGAKPPVADTVAPAEAAPPLVAASDAGLLAPLLDRLRGSGVAIAPDATLEAETLRLGELRVALSDGRTCAERSAAFGRPMLLLDLARDFATTPVLGATGSPEHLAMLAAALQPAGIAVIALADVAGLVLTRVVACLANEAADVTTWTTTTPADIDIAMRLGTAYPIGPLAWADALGPTRLVTVLTHLQTHYGDARYRRAPQLLAKHFAKSKFHE
ncbi:MAG TPA: 3-hydroxyacyl-CoA dehydrogenase [Burkholderiaceae bacterium]|nr:3-hydroxyacyl-CoA dehydrogenase [Burkholderiaceae bacterium]